MQSRAANLQSPSFDVYFREVWHFGDFSAYGSTNVQ